MNAVNLGRAIVAIALVGACQLGRLPAEEKEGATPQLAGKWRAILPREYVQEVTLNDLGEGRYRLSSRADVFNGIYQWKEGKLTVVNPADKRMQGLVWQGNGRLLRLIDEPKVKPTGSSYTGTTLTRWEE